VRSEARFRIVAAVGLVLAFVLGACVDPGCIRHSECGHGYICTRAMCVVEPRDGGSSAEPELPDDELDSGFE
jgi:hypothetical protein